MVPKLINRKYNDGDVQICALFVVFAAIGVTDSVRYFVNNKDNFGSNSKITEGLTSNNLSFKVKGQDYLSRKHFAEHNEDISTEQKQRKNATPFQNLPRLQLIMKMVLFVLMGIDLGQFLTSLACFA